MALQSNELFWIVVIVVLLFGAASIPKLARALGRAKGEFQAARSEFDREATAATDEARARAAASRTAAATTTPAVDPQQEQRIRQAARDMGIQEEGMSVEEVKRALNEMLG